MASGGAVVTGGEGSFALEEILDGFTVVWELNICWSIESVGADVVDNSGTDGGGCCTIA